MVYTLPNMAVKPLACGLWFRLSFENFDIDKRTVHGKLLLSCFFTITLTVFEKFLGKLSMQEREKQIRNCTTIMSFP